MKWLSLISGEPVPLSSRMSNTSLSSFRKMTSFPPQRWDVRFTKDIDTLTCSSASAFGSGGLGISMEAFLVVKPATREEGSFRFVLDGPEKLNIKFNVQSVLPSGLFSRKVAEADM